MDTLFSNFCKVNNLPAAGRFEPTARDAADKAGAGAGVCEASFMDTSVTEYPWQSRLVEMMSI